MFKRCAFFIFILSMAICQMPLKGDIHNEASDSETYEKKESADFSNILLIINYNHPYYDSIPFLKETYSPLFPHIVFYGEAPHPEVIVNPHHYGYYCQNAIADAMKRWPNYEGYICLQDDCIMNYWNFANLDKNKVWMPASNNWIWVSFLESSHWVWWDKPIGRTAVEAGLKILPKKYLAIMESNYPKGKMFGCYVDLMYVPARLRESFIEVAEVLSHEPVFVEIAIPLILSCIDSNKNWEPLSVLWELDPLVTREKYNASYHWAHPFKFSQQSNRDFLKNAYEKQRDFR